MCGNPISTHRNHFKKFGLKILKCNISTYFMRDIAIPEFKDALGYEHFLVLDWEEIHRMTENLVDRITESYQPTMIVGIKTGGMFPAILAYHALGLEEIRSIGLRNRGKGTEQSTLIMYQPLPRAKLNEHKVLLVDEVVDSGDTLREAKRKLESREPNIYRTAALHVKDGTTEMPDYLSEIISSEIWIMYPWERSSMTSMLIERLRRKSYTDSDMRDLIVQKLGFPEFFFDKGIYRGQAQKDSMAMGHSYQPLA